MIIDFLFMALLQTIPGLSPTGQFTAFIPLCFGMFLCVQLLFILC